MVEEHRTYEPQEGEHRWTLQLCASTNPLRGSCWEEVKEFITERGGYADLPYDHDAEAWVTCKKEDILDMPRGWVFSYRRRY